MADKQDDTLNLLQEEQSAAPVMEPEPPKLDGATKKKRTRSKSGTAKAETAVAAAEQAKVETVEKKKRTTKKSSSAKKRASASVGSSQSDTAQQEPGTEETVQAEAQQAVQPEDTAESSEVAALCVSAEKAPENEALVEEAEKADASQTVTGSEQESATVQAADSEQKLPDSEDSNDLPDVSDLLKLPDFSPEDSVQLVEAIQPEADCFAASELPQQELSELPDGISELPSMDFLEESTEIDPLQMMTDAKAQESATEKMQTEQPETATEPELPAAELVSAVEAKPKKSLFARLRSWLSADDVAQAATPAMAHISPPTGEATGESDGKEPAAALKQESQVESEAAETSLLSQSAAQNENTNENIEEGTFTLLPEISEAPVQAETLEDETKAQEEPLEMQQESQSLIVVPQGENDKTNQANAGNESAISTIEQQEVPVTIDAEVQEASESVPSVAAVEASLEAEETQESLASSTGGAEKLSAQELAKERRKKKKDKKKARRAAAQGERGAQSDAAAAALTAGAVAVADTNEETQDACAKSEQSVAHFENGQIQESQGDISEFSEVPEEKEASEQTKEAESSGQQDGAKIKERTQEAEAPKEDDEAEKSSETREMQDDGTEKTQQDALDVELGKQQTGAELASLDTDGQTAEEHSEAFEAALPRRRITVFKVFVSFTAVVTFMMALFVVLLFLMSDNTLLKPKNEVDLPNFYGKKALDVVGDEAFAGFNIELEDVYTGDEEKGTIIDQRPKAPRKVKENAKIILRVSAGIQTVEMPDVLGIERDEAKRLVRESGLNVLFKPIVDETVDMDDVVETEPKAGTVLNAGETVTLYISRSQQTEGDARVPNCIGMTSTSKAATMLLNRGLCMGSVRRVASGQPAGTIIDQSPAAGSVQPQGTPVTITISADTPAASGGAASPSGGVAEDGHQHAFSVQVVPATDGAPGFTIHTCTICGFYTLGNIG